MTEAEKLQFSKLYNSVKVLLADGSYITLGEHQKALELKEGSAQIARHFSFTEPKFAEDLRNYGELIVCAPLMRVLDVYRALVNAPVNINSFNRNEEKQQSLKAQGARAATFSPHVVKLAADVDTKDEEDTRKKVVVMLEAAKMAKVPIRIGYEDYIKAGQSFIHVDVCPLYYAKGKVWNAIKHPEAWEFQNSW